MCRVRMEVEVGVEGVNMTTHRRLWWRDARARAMCNKKLESPLVKAAKIKKV